MLITLVMFICPLFVQAWVVQKIFLLGKFVPNNQKHLFEIKLGAYTNSNILKSMIASFFYTGPKIHFSANV